MSNSTIRTTYNLTFWVHLFVTVLSWFIPFLFDWRLVLTAYTCVLLQFHVFGGCLMNRGHALDDAGNDDTFYAHLLEMSGFHFNRRRVKTFVRLWIYVLLAAMALWWQVWAGHAALIF